MSFELKPNAEIIQEIRDRYLKDNEIIIPEHAFTSLKEKYAKEELSHSLSYIIVNDNIKLPLKAITLQEALRTQVELSKLETSIKEGMYSSRYLSSDKFSGLYFDESNKYNIASDYFHQENRYKCDSINSPSPYRTFHEVKFAASMCNALFTLKEKEVNSKSLHHCLALRKYIASQFKPSVAKAIYDYYHAERIVDLCAGWGDRLSGFFASKYGKSYFGVDANRALQDGYAQQIKEYSNLFTNKTATVIYGATEDEDVVLPECDFILTSPPYFGIEKYSKDEKQSYVRYRKIDAWLNNFLFRALQKGFDALVSGGRMVINISDVYMNHTVNKICEPMLDYAQEHGMILEAIHGMQMAKRTNSKSDKEGMFVEPLFVFRKG